MNERAAPEAGALDRALHRLEPMAVLPQYAEGVARWVDVLAAHIAAIDAVEMADTVEPASVFRA